MPADLCNLNFAKASAFPNITDSTSDNVIQTLIAVASRAAETWCKRVFSVNNYDEVYDSDGSGSVFLRNFPVLSISRMAMTTANVLSVRNNNRTTNSRAWIATTQVAQQEAPTPTTGLMLQRVANGVTVTDATFVWNNYPIVQNLSDAINALATSGVPGQAWQGIIQGGYNNWATADITPLRGAQNALQNQANLMAHTTDLNDYDVVVETGEIRFSGSLAVLFGTGWVPTGFAGVGMGDLWPGVNLPRGSRNIRVQYTAGFNQIPAAVQQAVALWAAHLFQQPGYAGNLTSESLGDYSMSRMAVQNPPPDVCALLMPWRDIKI